jgi:hypothetical protein
LEFCYFENLTRRPSGCSVPPPTTPPPRTLQTRIKWMNGGEVGRGGEGSRQGAAMRHAIVLKLRVLGLSKKNHKKLKESGLIKWQHVCICAISMSLLSTPPPPSAEHLLRQVRVRLFFFYKEGTRTPMYIFIERTVIVKLGQLNKFWKQSERSEISAASSNIGLKSSLRFLSRCQVLLSVKGCQLLCFTSVVK